MRWTALALSMLLACHHEGRREAFGRVLERGGLRLDDTSTHITERGVTVWGVIEVPDGSRLQATLAGADAIARSELLKLIRVRIQDEMVSVDSTDPARIAAYEHTVESVHGSLRGAGITEHGWERVQRDEVILRVWSRLTVSRADFDAAFRALSPDRAFGTSALPVR
jgi:hypothetical protein